MEFFGVDKEAVKDEPKKDEPKKDEPKKEDSDGELKESGKKTMRELMAEADGEDKAEEPKKEEEPAEEPKKEESKDGPKEEEPKKEDSEEVSEDDMLKDRNHNGHVPVTEEELEEQALNESIRAVRQFVNANKRLFG